MSKFTALLLILTSLFIYSPSSILAQAQSSTGSSHAQETEEYSGIWLQKAVVDQFIETGSVDPDRVEDLLKDNILKAMRLNQSSSSANLVNSLEDVELIKPRFSKNGNGYILQTGKLGTIELVVEKGKYYLHVDPIPGVDIYLPKTINFERDSFISIGVTLGSGEVINNNLMLDIPSNKEVGLMIYSEANQNSIYDQNEKALYWPGFKLYLLKDMQKKTITLNPGWNLISFPYNPARSLTARNLLSMIISQGGEATSVSSYQDGSWKTYIGRDGDSYSLNDFQIEVGKAYFIKSLRSSEFVFDWKRDPNDTFKINLSPGWNAIGLPDNQSMKASSLIDRLNLRSAEVDVATKYETGLYQSFIKQNNQNYGEDFELFPWLGYFIRVGQDTEVNLSEL